MLALLQWPVLFVDLKATYLLVVQYYCEYAVVSYETLFTNSNIDPSNCPVLLVAVYLLNLWHVNATGYGPTDETVSYSLVCLTNLEELEVSSRFEKHSYRSLNLHSQRVDNDHARKSNIIMVRSTFLLVTRVSLLTLKNARGGLWSNLGHLIRASRRLSDTVLNKSPIFALVSRARCRFIWVLTQYEN